MRSEASARQTPVNLRINSLSNLLEMAVIALAVAGLLYFGYFQLAPWIWGQSLPFSPEDITPWVLFILNDRDGGELYALYALMFFNLLSVYALTYGWGRFARKAPRYLLLLPAVVAGVFLYSIGFHPPMSVFAEHSMLESAAQSLTLILVILPIIALLYYLQQNSIYGGAAVAILLIPVCFVSTAAISWYDYSFILAPALRLFHGADVAEVYFQYDLFLSLLGLAWMKLSFDLNSFQIVAQSSFYLLFWSVFVFSSRWFMDKRLVIFLLIALVLVRIYPGMFDASEVLQVTPFRLDMWLILLLLVHFKGVQHWSAGLFCGLMLLLHKNFGVIYSAAYIQLLLTLCIIDRVVIPGKVIKTALLVLSSFFKNNYRNFALILLGAVVHFLLFRNENAQAEFNFVSLGIGFTKVARDSFYWYVVAMSGLSFVLLLRLRPIVSNRYWATGFCLIYLVIGNSLYFFGRSHENNIINISASLLLLFFFLLDMIGKILAKTPRGQRKLFIQRNLTVIVSLFFIVSITIWYGDRIADRVATQVGNLVKRQFIYPSSVSAQEVLNAIAEVKSVTGETPKVYFVGDNDFLMDYYGGYAPVGYYSPVYASISKREFDRFLQGLLDQGYYLVIDNGLIKDVLTSAINFSSNKRIAGRVVVWKQSEI